MILVWFVYGLAFFVLGLVVLVYPKQDSKFELAGHVWKIGAFGMLHGINEWLDMFIAIGGPLPPVFMENARMATLSGSFMFLLLFGSTAIATRLRHPRLVRIIPGLLTLVWLVVLVVVEAQQKLVLGDILARYLLGAPGAFLTATALLSRAPQFRAMKLGSVAVALTVAAVTTIVYGVLAGIIVKKAGFFPANVLNYETFRAATGVPVQVFRAACAVVVAGSAIHILDAFRWETRETLRMSELRCGTIATSIPVLLFMTDRNMVVTFAQGKGLDVLGLSPTQIQGRAVAEVFPSTERFAEDCRQALSGRDTVTVVSRNSLTFEISSSALRDPGGEPVGIVGVALDISARVRAQEELDEYRLALERQARQAAVGALSSTLAQQLAEPLSVARLVLDKAVSDLERSDAGSALRNGVAKGLSAVSRAQEILDRFTEVAQPGSPPRAQPVGLYQIARRMMGVFAESAQRRGLTIAIKDLDAVPVMALTSRELEQILYHLIQRAVDATEPGRRQRLTISCETSSDRVDLIFSRVREEAGLPQPPVQGWIADMGGAKEVDYLGLGLAIVKRIIENHEGRLSCNVEPSGATTTVVRLPKEGTH
ncbi:MAG: PAS domain-containing protein [Sedimentisphaerales bacterium]|nr:PAS domain-containing protein [Sedimentisphaerales bacterium]